VNVIVFEDELVERLDPIAVGRPAFGVACGGYRLVELAGRLGQPVQLVVREHLEAVVQADAPAGLAPAALAPADTLSPCLFVNARLVPAAAVVRRLAEFVQAGRPGVVYRGDAVAAALLPGGLDVPLDLMGEGLTERLRRLWLDPFELELPLLDYPHDLIRWHQATLAENLADRLASGQYREIAAGVFAAEGAALTPQAAADAAAGPIVLEAGATVRPFAVLCGPILVGPRAEVLEHATIKGPVAVGEGVRLGGEVNCSILEAFSNKRHYGFLGHSYVGSWVNLAAGTSNSNLKNTYGEVTADYGAGKAPTGMQFLGCVIGDYARTALNTGIYAGKRIGVGSIVYGLAAENVPSFVNYARSQGQVTAVSLDVAIEVQARMFARRGLTPRPCDVQLLRDMYELTRPQRADLPVAALRM
jgi:glucose-1-phosphate thymidylyltransferase